MKYICLHGKVLLHEYEYYDFYIPFQLSFSSQTILID